MLQESTTDEIGTRVKAVNRSLRWLAKAAAIDPMTVKRGPKTVRKHNALVDALQTEEFRLLDHLAAIYPQRAMQAATVALCPERQPRGG